MRGRRRERLRVESRVHDTNLQSVGEQNRCQVGPTILFECPAQIPRSFLRSFSLWATPGSYCRVFQKAQPWGACSRRAPQVREKTRAHPAVVCRTKRNAKSGVGVRKEMAYDRRND